MSFGIGQIVIYLYFCFSRNIGYILFAVTHYIYINTKWILVNINMLIFIRGSFHNFIKLILYCVNDNLTIT